MSSKGSDNEKHPAPPPTVLSGAKEMLTGGLLNILLVCIPIAFMSQGLGWNDSVTFIFSLLAIAPLAERLGFVTEQLALHTNDTIGGLLNVTFGNATELIVAIAALFKGLYRVVQLTLLGSILSNMLLVLGCAFLFGGLRYNVQEYNKITSQVNMTLLMLSVMGLLFPSVLVGSSTVTSGGDLGFSRFTSLILFSLYLFLLYFQLFTHRHIYEGRPEPGTSTSTPTSSINVELFSRTKTDGSDRGSLVEPILDAREPHSHEAGGMAKLTSSPSAKEGDAESEEEEEEDLLGFYMSLFWLAIITVLISFLSDALVATINSAASSWGISALFLSSIVIPIIGNAAEHAGAVMFARKNKMDLSLAIAVGSSTQIALMVLPLLVLISWMGNRRLNLDFHGYESCCLFLTVVTVTFVLMDGRSNWLMGSALVAAYFIIAAGFWAHAPEDLSSAGG